MKVLEKHTTGHGFDHDVIERQGMAALVAATHKTSKHRHWEVWHIQSHPDMEVHGHASPAAEYPPGPNSWGKQGWTYVTEPEARIRYARLIRELEEKTSKEGQHQVPA